MRLLVYVKDVRCDGSDSSCLNCPIVSFDGKYDLKRAYIETIKPDIMGKPECVVDIFVENNAKDVIKCSMGLLRMVEGEARKVNRGKIEAYVERISDAPNSVKWYTVPPEFLELDLTDDRAIENALKVVQTPAV